MANTILERIQDKYPDVEGINDARNIAEALACISRTGGRGANAIADHIWQTYELHYINAGGQGASYTKVYAPITPVDLDPPESILPPEGKHFYGWGLTGDATEAVEPPYYITKNSALYALWVDNEEEP